MDQHWATASGQSHHKLQFCGLAAQKFEKGGPHGSPFLYGMSMAITNIDIDEVACRKVMERYQLATMNDAVNFALNQLVDEPMTLEEALAMEGTGWDGDLAEMRRVRFPLTELLPS